MSKKLVIFSFFSGSGFLDLGFENNGFQVDLVNEFQPAFLKAYQYSRAAMGMRKPKYGYFNIDINEFLDTRKAELQKYVLEAREDGSLVGFIGGPPCPDFSVAGKNKGRDGDNGKLSQSYTDLIVEMQPDFFLFENVKGLWRTARHRAFFEELKGKLHASGYATTERLTNSLEYGAPQDRDRILMFGVHQAILGNVDIDSFDWKKYHRYTLDEIKAMNWPETDAFCPNIMTEKPEGIDEKLTVQYWFEKNDVSKKSYKRLHRWRFSPTVAYGNNEVHLHPYRIRRISAAEALALQTLPKEFALPADMTLTNKFKTIGNGVPYLLACGIARTIKDFLEVL